MEPTGMIRRIRLRINYHWRKLVIFIGVCPDCGNGLNSNHCPECGRYKRYTALHHKFGFSTCDKFRNCDAAEYNQRRHPKMITKDDIVYISGRMTGLKDFGHDSFCKAGYFLITEIGCIVHNPALSFGGKKDLPRKVYMRHDIHLILEATCLLMLEGWRMSKGARFEHEVAKELGLRIYYTNSALSKVTEEEI